MYWKARIGVAFPSRGDVATYEFYRVAPEGVVLVSTSMNVEKLVDEYFERALKNMDEAVRLLQTEQVDVILIGGNPVMTMRGFEYNDEVIERYQKATGLPVTTSFSSYVDALQALGAQKIALASPYGLDALEREAKSLEFKGLKVVGVHTLGIVRNSDIAILPPAEAYRCAKEAVLRSTEKPDAVFITCPRWPTLSIIADLEADLGIPAVSNSQAIAWNTLRLARVRPNVKGMGQLFDIYP